MTETKHDFELTNEIKAHLNQCVYEAFTYFEEETKTGITLQRIQKEDQEDTFVALLDFEMKSGTISTSGESSDVFKAISNASESLMSKITQLHNVLISNKERDLEIHNLSKNRYLH